MKTKLQLLIVGLLLATIGTGLGQPNITNQPQPCTNVVGTTATFTVGVTGTEPLAYQWQRKEFFGTITDLAGCTNAALVLTNVQTSHAADYGVVVTNIQGVAYSDFARLTVIGPPKITLQPTDWPSVSLGASVTNSVLASGTGPLAYQWCFNGAPLPGQTKNWIIVTNVPLSAAGDYTAVVTNLIGSVTSRVVRLTVDPTFTQINTGVLVTDTAGGWHGCWVDYDGDGNLDFSAAPSGGLTEATRIYHNEGNGSFRKVTTNAIAQTLVQSYTHVWGDYDNDGKVDLFVPNTWGILNDMLFHNNGNGSFTRITSGHPVIDGANSITGAWADYDRDGFLDLFVITAGCPGQYDMLYRNNGDGTFRKMTAAEVGPIISEPGASDLTVWADVDNDGWPELVRNHNKNNCAGSESWTNQVYHLDSQGKFYLMDIGEMKKGTEGYVEPVPKERILAVALA